MTLPRVEPQLGLRLVLLFSGCSFLLLGSVVGTEACVDGVPNDAGTCALGAAGSDDVAGVAEPGMRWSNRNECEELLKAMPTRGSFFQRVGIPPGADEARFRQMLARGGIHPRGVILETEFYELPLTVNKTLLREEVDALLAGNEWEAAQEGNVEQGVVSKHFRLTEGEEDLVGPFRDLDQRLERSPYLRSILASLGGVIGNTALMGLPAGETVDAHFDTNPYWDARVRVHIPVRTNKKVTFSCGQRDEEHTIHMKAGNIYLFDNHLGHSVSNKGTSARLHLTVDLVGSRRFWKLVQQGRALGSVSKPVSEPSRVIDWLDEAPQIATEAWSDTKLRASGCEAVAEAILATAAQLGQQEEASRLTSQWCPAIERAPKRASRAEEVDQLRLLAVKHHCEVAAGSQPTSTWDMTPSLLDIVDTVLELHRLSEADWDLPVVGGQEVS